MFNKKNLFTLMTAAVISGVLVICTIARDLRQEKIIAKIPPVVSELEPVPYVVKEYNGSLAVFKGDSEQPYRILDCEYSLLSDYDKEAFRFGFTVETESELNSLIEDFES